jgi:prepilin peptidase CpaA
MWPTYLCFGGFLTMLGLAAWKDVCARRIPNRLTGGLAALYPVYDLISPAAVAWPAALGLAALVFLVGLALFARQLIGGGDVKLIAALTLWAGPEQFVWFMLVTHAGRGRAQPDQPVVPALGHAARGALRHLGRAATGARAALLADASAPNPASQSTTLPYGVAIAAGGIAIIIELATL